MIGNGLAESRMDSARPELHIDTDTTTEYHDPHHQSCGRECEALTSSESSPMTAIRHILSESPSDEGQSDDSPPSERPSIPLNVRAWEIIQKEISDFYEPYGIGKFHQSHYFGNVACFGSVSGALTKTSDRSVYCQSISRASSLLSMKDHLKLLTYQNPSLG